MNMLSRKYAEISLYGLYWRSAVVLVIFFNVQRFIFLAFQTLVNKTSLPNDFYLAFISGLAMDMSTWAYLISLPGIIILFQLWLPFKKIWLAYQSIVITILSGVFAADVILYKEWGYRIDITPFKYLWGSQEVMNFISFSMFFQSIFLFILQLTVGYFLYKLILRKISFTPWNAFHYILAIAFVLLLIIPMRGGFGLAPMNPSKVYYSKNLYSNHVAINPIWNIFYTVNQEWNKKSAPKFSSPEKTKHTIDSLYARKESKHFDSIFHSKPKQIVFILLESFTYNLIHFSHKSIEVTPRLNEWIRKGLFYNNAFSSGDRTDKGLVSILSGFPSQPTSSIMHYPKKSQRLPSLIKSLSPLVHHSIFYYGGDIHFSGMKSYLLAMGFDNILDKDHFPDKEMNAKWGVHDHVLFEKVFEDYILENTEKIQVALSLSSHPPYDIPEPNTWHEKDEETQFINSAHYTDKHFGILLDKMSQTSNWKHTLVIVLADHGCRFPGNVPYHVPEKFKIPILWTGGVIQIDSVSNAVTSQQDICASLLSQLDIPYNDFTFSQNIFSNHYKPFAYYAFNNGITWIDEDGSFIYSLDKLNWISDNPKNKQKEDVLKIYFQAVFDNIQME